MRVARARRRHDGARDIAHDGAVLSDVGVDRAGDAGFRPSAFHASASPPPSAASNAWSGSVSSSSAAEAGRVTTRRGNTTSSSGTSPAHARSACPSRRRSVRPPARRPVRFRRRRELRTGRARAAPASSCHPPSGPPYAAHGGNVIDHVHANEVGALAGRDLAAVGQADGFAAVTGRFIVSFVSYRAENCFKFTWPIPCAAPRSGACCRHRYER